MQTQKYKPLLDFVKLKESNLAWIPGTFLNALYFTLPVVSKLRTPRNRHCIGRVHV